MKHISEIKNLLVNENDDFKIALKSLNNSGKKICLVVNSDTRLIGVITDGDIRRNLLKKNTKLKCGLISSKTYLSTTLDYISDSLLVRAKKKFVKDIPIVDNFGKLVGIHFLSENFKRTLDTPLVIMAGGLGKRLRPLTLKKPKPLINVGGSLLLDEIIKNAQLSGIQKIYISVNYLKDKIYKHVKKMKYSNLEVIFLKEKKPLGTAGALKQLYKMKEENFIVTNGDVFTGLNFLEVLKNHKKQKNQITICAKEKIDQIKYGVLEFKKNNLLNIKEKPLNKYYINAGIYVINKDVFKNIKINQKIDMPELIEKVMDKKKKIGCHIIKEFWIDIGNKSDLEIAKEIFKNDK